MLTAAYGDEILCLPKCGVVMDATGQNYTWRGPRVRMGVCQGTPQAIMPHSSSGRADYFGAAVNRRENRSALYAHFKIGRAHV